MIIIQIIHPQTLKSILYNLLKHKQTRTFKLS